LQAVRAAQAALSLLNTLIIYRLALVAYSRRTALWAAAGYCFYPSLLGFNQFLLSETLFTFFVSLITWVCAEALRRDSLRWLVVVGLLLGLGALTRSILWLFAPILSAYLFVAWRGRIRERLLAAVVPALLFGVTIAPWAWRNTRLHETPVLIDVMGGRNVMMGNYEHTPLERSWATISLVQGERAWHAVLLREHPQTTPLTQGQLDKLAMRHGIRFALQHPALTAQRTLVRFFNFWQLERTLVAGAQAGFFGDLSTVEKLGLAAVVCGSYAAAIFLGIFGAATAPPADRRLHALLLLTVLFPCAVHSLIFAHSRYHLPIMPIVLVYSAAAIVQFRSLGRPRGWRFDLALLLCVILVLGWLRELVFVDLANASQLVG
ncbi:MAG: ArnT family glycosyltransferase, partial [Planctomycetaceae bacterium]